MGDKTFAGRSARARVCVGARPCVKRVVLKTACGAEAGGRRGLIWLGVHVRNWVVGEVDVGELCF